MPLTEPEKAIITWHVNAIEIKGEGDEEGLILNLGVCSRSKRVAFVSTNMLSPLIVRDIYVYPDKKRCEDGDWCLYLKCPLNSIKIYKLSHLTIENERELHNFLKHLHDWEKALSPKHLKSLPPNVISGVEEPLITLTIHSSNQKVKT